MTDETRIGGLTIWPTVHEPGGTCWWVRPGDTVLHGCYDNVETAIAAAHLTDTARAQLTDDLDGQPASIEDVEVAAMTRRALARGGHPPRPRRLTHSGHG